MLLQAVLDLCCLIFQPAVLVRLQVFVLALGSTELIFGNRQNLEHCFPQQVRKPLFQRVLLFLLAVSAVVSADFTASVVVASTGLAASVVVSAGFAGSTGLSAALSQAAKKRVKSAAAPILVNLFMSILE